MQGLFTPDRSPYCTKFRTRTAEISPFAAHFATPFLPRIRCRQIFAADLTTILYPVGTCSNAIRPSIAPNRRRVRWLSASKSQ